MLYKSSLVCRYIARSLGLDWITACSARCDGEDGGVSCIALCGCLTESYDTFFGAQVLGALCKIRCPDIPSELLPGIRPWQALLRPCIGIFSNTKFPKLVDGFQRFLGFRY